MKQSDPAAFVLKHTTVETPPLAPEIRLHLASEALPLWRASEEELEAMGLPPPYWAFAWAGGQALARWVLDNPAAVRGKRVLDFASGSGMAGIAAAKAGAAWVEASDIDRFAQAAIALNASLNSVRIAVLAEDQVGRLDGDWQVVLAGDICYERPMAERSFKWLQALAAAGTRVLLGDPGRSYLPKSGLSRLAGYAVQTSRELEDSDIRNAVVWCVTGAHADDPSSHLSDEAAAP